MLESFDYYPLPQADKLSIAEAMYGSPGRVSRMPELTEGCKVTIREKEYYYQYECKKLNRRLK